jgi:hypothetical protein
MHTSTFLRRILSSSTHWLPPVPRCSRTRSWPRSRPRPCDGRRRRRGRQRPPSPSVTSPPTWAVAIMSEAGERSSEVTERSNLIQSTQRPAP